MLAYLKAFLERLGPVGFGLAISAACLMMFGAMLDTGKENGMRVIAAVFAAVFVGGFTFFAVGTVVVVVRKIYRALVGGRTTGRARSNPSE
jgi:hypothetical protein